MKAKITWQIPYKSANYMFREIPTYDKIFEDITTGNINWSEYREKSLEALYKVKDKLSFEEFKELRDDIRYFVKYGFCA